MKLNPEKPPYSFCWWCSRALYGGRGVKAIANGLPVWVHAECKSKLP